MISSHDPSALICRHFLGRQIVLGDLAQPFLGDRRRRISSPVGDHALEHLAEDPVEAVELALVVNEHRAGQIIELLGLGGDHLGVERLEQQQMLLQAGGNPPAPQRLDEGDEHGASLYRSSERRGADMLARDSRLVVNRP